MGKRDASFAGRKSDLAFFVILFQYSMWKYEPPRDKTNKVTVRPAKTLIRDWADDQADLSLCWAHTHFIGFVMRRLIYR